MTKQYVTLLDEFYAHAAKNNWSPFDSIERTSLRIFAEWLDRRPADEPRDELPTAELYNRVGQLLAGWKQGCAPGEWSDFDESVLQAWQSWRVMQMRRHQNDLSSACGERFGNGAHHECSREPNHPGKCRCSCGAENRDGDPCKA